MVAVPLQVEHGRPFVDIVFAGPHGPRVATAWLDTGGGPLLMGTALVEALGASSSPQVIDGEAMDVLELPAASIGGVELLREDHIALAAPGELINEGFPADCFVPAHVLAAHHCVFDYPARTFELLAHGSARGGGAAVPCPSRRRPGWPAVEVAIGDRVVPLLVDTGASCCMVSMAVFGELTAGLSSDRKALGAVGAANMSAGAWERQLPLARLPELRLGPHTLNEVVVVGRPEGNFEGMVSSGTAIPVVGALAGNVLRRMRLELYAEPDVAFVDLTDERPDVVDMVPLVVQSLAGSIVIHGSASRDGAPLVDGVGPGDRLVAVDDRPVDPARFGDVVAQLAGDPGDTRDLEINRAGIAIKVTAEVQRVV